MPTSKSDSRSRRPGLTGRMALLVMALCLPQQGCGVGYVLSNGLYQMELLAARKPVTEVRAQCALTDAQRQALDLVEDVKGFGSEIGLSGMANYETVAAGWDHKIWNLSGCDPLSFEPETWWFPIVGRVPYLGYFVEEDAREKVRSLEAAGLDVYLRTAGTYSTLGWFEDPLLVPMLDWEPYDLINTVLHELTHATIWLPGSVGFNESFANFVGEKAAFAYIESRYGRSSIFYEDAARTVADRQVWRTLLKGLFDELSQLYADEDLSDEAKLTRKAEIFASVPERIGRAGFAESQQWLSYASRTTWNNARLVQFRTYNSNREWFQAIFDAHGGDLLPFMKAIETIVEDADDPYQALREAAGR